jgi:hypothetical protein
LKGNDMPRVAFSFLLLSIASCTPISNEPDAARLDGALLSCATDADCVDASDCTVDSCEVASGVCRHAVTPALCPPGESCDPIDGCTPGRPCGTDADCMDGDPCTTSESCDPATRVCVHRVLDGDGDGDPPRSCAGNDCDDSRPSVYGGAAEACNNLDDDCDAMIDEAPATATTCGAGSFTCREGACVCTAATLSDPMNCGSCGNVCGAGSACVGGACSCPTGAIHCPGIGCTMLGSDPMNCGRCGSACASGAVCAAGSCCTVSGPEVCNGGDDDCDGATDEDFFCARFSLVSCAVNCGGLPETGTATTSCPDDCSEPTSCPGSWDGFTGEIYGGSICGGTCCSDGCPHCHDGWDGDCDGLVDCADTDCRGELVADPACCGTPGLPCCTNMGFEYCTSGDCSGGTCACPSGLTPCAGTCVDTATDTANCGSCGASCATGGVCASGSCACPGADGRVCGGICTDVAIDEANCGACGATCPATQACVGSSCRDILELVVPADVIREIRRDDDLWSDARNWTTGTVSPSTTTGTVGSWYSGYWDLYRIRRLTARFPRPTLPAGAVVVGGAHIVRPSAVVDPAGLFGLRVSSFRPVSPPGIIASDYGISRWGTDTTFVSGFDLAVGADTRADLPVDAVATFSSASTHWFLGMRSGPDVTGSSPPSGESTLGGTHPEVRFAAPADVRLVVRYVP